MSVVRSTGTWPVALRWELVKLFTHRWVQALAVAVLVVPALIAGVLAGQSSAPTDSLFGRWVHTSGYATPLVVLGFAGQWVLPLLVAVVAGDLMSSEDRHGTWPTVLTRSTPRAAVVAAKVAVAALWTVGVVVVLAVVATVTSVLLVGSAPLVGLDGATVAPGTAAGLVAAAWATALLPSLAYAALALAVSAASRSSVVGVGVPVVLGVVMQLVALLPAAHSVRPYLLSTGYDAWHALVAGQPQPGAVLAPTLVGLAWLVAALGALAVVVEGRQAAA